MGKIIGETFGDEAVAAGVPVDNYTVGADESEIWAPAADPAALRAVIAAHDPNKRFPRYAVLVRLIGVLTDAEVDILSTQAKKKDQWVILARGMDQVPENNPKLARVCLLLGITPKEWFDRVLGDPTRLDLLT